jgi:peptidyl-prolyl cis-trans isomerase C
MTARTRIPTLTAVLLPALAASAMLLAGCGQKSAGTGATADNVAVVNGKPISRNTYEHYVQGVANRPASELTPEQRAELLDNLIRGELIASEAETTGLAAKDDTRAVLDLSRLTVLQQAASQDYLKDRKATDAELKAEYDTQVAQMARTEFRARHILVNTEEFARNLIRQLDRGADFAQLAKKESLDNGSRESGGELGWFAPDRMVPPFAEAVAKLDKGQVTKDPVQTSFGWHVIQLEDRRDAAPPPFDSVKERLVQIVEAKKFRAHTDELLAAAKIERTLDKPAAAVAAPATSAPAAAAPVASEPAPTPAAAPAPAN